MQAGIVADYIRLVWLVNAHVLTRNAACWKKIGAVLHPFMGQWVQPCTKLATLNKPESLCPGFGKTHLLIDLRMACFASLGSTEDHCWYKTNPHGDVVCLN
jgi:hypothetical protein